MQQQKKKYTGWSARSVVFFVVIYFPLNIIIRMNNPCEARYFLRTLFCSIPSVNSITRPTSPAPPLFRNSDPGSHSRHFPPPSPSMTVRAFHFVPEKGSASCSLIDSGRNVHVCVQQYCEGSMSGRAREVSLEEMVEVSLIDFLGCVTSG